MILSMAQRFFPGLLCAAALALALAGYALEAQAASPDEKAVVARLQALLDGLAKRDKAMMVAQPAEPTSSTW
jgi:hypothetical protein